MRIALAIVAVLLGACAPAITLQERGGKETASGAMDGLGLGFPTGSMRLTLGGKSYEGQWMAGGSSTGFVTGTAGSSAFYGTVIGYSPTASGSALLRASDGSGLRCNFNYAKSYFTGFGECQDDAGKMYDMLIR